MSSSRFDDYAVEVAREQHDAEMTGLWETLRSLGVPEAEIAKSVDVEGSDVETFEALLRKHTRYNSLDEVVEQG